jgi:hypothetical protein
MKPDRTPLAVLVSGILISGAILTNGYLERQAYGPVRFVPTKEQIHKALGESRLYSTEYPGKPGTNFSNVEITKVLPSDDGRKVCVELSFTTADKEIARSEFVLERDDFGRYSGRLRYKDGHAYVSVRH